MAGWYIQFKLPFSGLNFTSGVEDAVGAGVEDGGVIVDVTT